MLGQRLRRWPNIEPTLHKCTMFERKSSFPANTKHLYNIYTTSAQRLRRWSNIVQSHTNVVFTGCRYTHGVSLFRNTHSNAVSLFAKQGPAKIQDKGLWDSMELLLIDVAQVYMNLLWFENLLLMRLWVWNTYLVLLWNRALAYPRALLPSGGPLSREFWQLTTPLIVFFVDPLNASKPYRTWATHGYFSLKVIYKWRNPSDSVFRFDQIPSQEKTRRSANVGTMYAHQHCTNIGWTSRTCWDLKVNENIVQFDSTTWSVHTLDMSGNEWRPSSANSATRFDVKPALSQHWAEVECAPWTLIKWWVGTFTAIKGLSTNVVLMLAHLLRCWASIGLTFHHEWVWNHECY